MAEDDRGDRLLARRLQHLYDTVHPAGRKPYSDREVAEAVNEAAGEQITGRTYLYQLRTGRSANPTYKLLIGLARFFGVPPTYFFSEEETARGELPPEVVAVLRDDGVRNLALKAAGLSEQSRQAIEAMIESARAIEGKTPGGGSPA